MTSINVNIIHVYSFCGKVGEIKGLNLDYMTTNIYMFVCSSLCSVLQLINQIKSTSIMQHRVCVGCNIECVLAKMTSVQSCQQHTEHFVGMGT